MPFLRATGYFHDSKFFACFVSTKSYVLLSDGAGDVAEYHVLRRQRSHVFLTLRFAQREDRGGTPFIRGLCSAQAGEQALRRVDDGGRCKMSQMKPAGGHDDGRG